MKDPFHFRSSEVRSAVHPDDLTSPPRPAEVDSKAGPQLAPATIAPLERPVDGGQDYTADQKAISSYFVSTPAHKEAWVGAFERELLGIAKAATLADGKSGDPASRLALQARIDAFAARAATNAQTQAAALEALGRCYAALAPLEDLSGLAAAPGDAPAPAHSLFGRVAGRLYGALGLGTNAQALRAAIDAVPIDPKAPGATPLDRAMVAEFFYEIAHAVCDGAKPHGAQGSPVVAADCVQTICQRLYGVKDEEGCRKQRWIEAATKGLGLALEQRAEPIQAQFAAAVGAGVMALREEPLYFTLATLGASAPDFACRLMPALEVSATSSDRLHGMAMGLGRGGYARDDVAFMSLIRSVMMAQSGHDRALQCFVSGFAHSVDQDTFEKWAPQFRRCCGDDERALELVNDAFRLGRTTRQPGLHASSAVAAPAPKVTPGKD